MVRHDHEAMEEERFDFLRTVKRLDSRPRISGVHKHRCAPGDVCCDQHDDVVLNGVALGHVEMLRHIRGQRARSSCVFYVCYRFLFTQCEKIRSMV